MSDLEIKLVYSLCKDQQNIYHRPVQVHVSLHIVQLLAMSSNCLRCPSPNLKPKFIYSVYSNITPKNDYIVAK